MLVTVSYSLLNGDPYAECDRCQTRYRQNPISRRIYNNGQTYAECPYCEETLAKESEELRKELEANAVF